MDEMTKRLYDFLIEYKSNNDGNSPNRDTMATAIGLRSKSGVNEYLDRLEALGKIKRGGRGVARDIRVVGGKWDFLEEPPPDVILKVYLVEHGYEAHVIRTDAGRIEQVRDFTDEVPLENLKINLVYRLLETLREFKDDPRKPMDEDSTYDEEMGIEDWDEEEEMRRES